MLVATKNTVFRADGNGRFESILSVAAAALIEDNESGVIVARSGCITADGSETETQIAEPIECAVRVGREILIGTEGPHVYRHTAGQTTRIDAFDQLDCRDSFYTPWGGPATVRSFASTVDSQIYADIHVGSIMRSPDAGQSWEPVSPDLHEDVHQVATTPAAPDRLYANTANGVYVSEDRGTSWDHRSKGFPYRYGRAVAVHPDDPDCMLASVSRGPHSSPAGQLYRSADAGVSWEHVAIGYPETVDHNIDTFQIAYSRDGRAWATSDRTLFVSEDRGRSWDQTWTAPGEISLIAC